MFIFAEIMMAVMGAIFGGMNFRAGSIVLTLVGGIIGHIIYGIIVSLLIKSE